jgi:hypothetical protein
MQLIIDLCLIFVGDRDDVLGRLVETMPSRGEPSTQLALIGNGGRKRKRDSHSLAESLPSNLHSMSAAQLRSVAISNRVHIPKDVKSKADILELIEEQLYAEEDSTVALGDKGTPLLILD